MRAKLFLVLASVLFVAATGLGAQASTLSLDGTWQLADSTSALEMPSEFPHSAPVPGLANQAQPPFADVDLFDSRELISNRIRSKKAPESTRVRTAGVPRQQRNFFWYQKEFTAPAGPTAARLKVNKAQFGTAVWLNGKKVGAYSGCFSAGYFDLSDAINWGSENTLVVRVGAHPAVLPDTFPTGTDFEKLKWTPGIYDSVSVHFSDNPVIEWVQVAPRITTSEIVVQTKVRNYGSNECLAHIVHEVRPWKNKKVLVRSSPLEPRLNPGEEKVLTQTIAVPGAELWTPETPNLHVVETTTGGDLASTRFGMREFRCDSNTQRCYLNGKVYYLRGSNITLHRFFEDPQCAGLPWDESWVRKLLVEIPKKMHWNSFRFCIGPAPEKWFEIADEAGLLIQNEFFVWTGAPSWDKGYRRTYNVQEMIRQYSDWMRDHWNHPSVAIWDANNETAEPLFAKKIIPAVRRLDLSNRPWENSYNGPPSQNDPVEDHPYMHSRLHFEDPKGFDMTMFEQWEGEGRPGKSSPEGQTRIINEYGWLWLNRDGSPTLLTEKVYDKILGPSATAEERFAMNAYLLAGKTEYWRAHRHYAGVLHFVYLTCSYPGVYTSDHWSDLKNLKLEPHFADYLGEAFKPLGVYVNFFQPTLLAGSNTAFRVFLVNDDYERAKGTLELTLENERGRTVARVSSPFAMEPLGAQTIDLPLSTPVGKVGKHLLKAAARTGFFSKPTISRRWIDVVQGDAPSPSSKQAPEAAIVITN